MSEQPLPHSASLPASGACMPLSSRDLVLTLSDHLDITLSIKEMENNDLITLGEALGLSRPKLQRMKDMPGDMVAAWLRQQDDVIYKTGDPTWRKLANALDRINQDGVAKKIRIAHNIPQPEISKEGTPNNVPTCTSDRDSVEEATNRPGQPQPCEEDEESDRLKKSLEEHKLTISNRDRQILLDNGIIRVENFLCLKTADVAVLMKELSVGGSSTLDNFWETKHKRVAHGHDPVNVIKEDKVQVGHTQPNSVADVKQTDTPGTMQQSRQQNSDVNETTPIQESEEQVDKASTSTVPNATSDESSKPDSTNDLLKNASAFNNLV